MKVTLIDEKLCVIEIADKTGCQGRCILVICTGYLFSSIPMLFAFKCPAAIKVHQQLCMHKKNLTKERVLILEPFLSLQRLAPTSIVY